MMAITLSSQTLLHCIGRSRFQWCRVDLRQMKQGGMGQLKELTSIFIKGDTFNHTPNETILYCI